ncbi:polysaccharide deacetylase family protein [Neolewinella litorea]|uniref:ChbG/HpnK family deacetylase n=1 Tax=Neolewinella litorea TaxID=2562452 RepID=A0A4V3XL51_9BACT|nr:polysaccharide deacetylase family protein [Neolewinella litorea]THH39493.1 ChbG/HpnK family deacetylase [Neolewinella litorea]
MRLFCCLAFLLFAGPRLSAQSLASILGYGPDEKLLIVHADDLGVTHATNQGSFQALDGGNVSSASIMANTPWLPEVARYAVANPDADLGMHLVLTSEWRDLKWGSVASADRVSSLLDSTGYLRPGCAEMARTAKPEEVRTEIKAQIEKARALGINPTHLDSHMGCLAATPELFRVYLETGREYGLPILISQNRLEGMDPAYRQAITNEDLVVDNLFTAGEPDYEMGLETYYRDQLADLPAGVNVLLIHTALDGAESAGMAGGVVGWGNRWRQLDYNFFSSQEFADLLEEEGIRLITWRQLAERWKEKR